MFALLIDLFGLRLAARESLWEGLVAVSFLSGDLVTGHDPWLVGEWHGIVLLNVTASGVRYELSEPLSRSRALIAFLPFFIFFRFVCCFWVCRTRWGC